MKKFLVFNYRGIFHLFGMIEIVFFSWLVGFTEIYDLKPENIPIKIVFLVVNYFVSEWSIKKSGMSELFEKEKKNYKN